MHELVLYNRICRRVEYGSRKKDLNVMIPSKDKLFQSLSKMNFQTPYSSGFIVKYESSTLVMIWGLMLHLKKSEILTCFVGNKYYKHDILST